MARRPAIPRHLLIAPFRGHDAVTKGELTRNMLRGNSWRRLLPDVYLHADAETDHRTWCEAVALRLPRGAAIAGPSAAYLWSVDLLGLDSPVTVVAPRSARLTPHPRIVVRYSTLPDGDLTRITDLPVTTPLRTAFDLGRQPSRTAGVVALDALVHHRLVAVGDVLSLATGRRGWRGVPALLAALELVEPLSESPMETVLRLLLLRYGLPRPVAQFEVRGAGGRFIARVDLAYPWARLALEYEGDHHRERRTFRRDVARLNALRAAGWTVLRFTADDVLRHEARTAAQVARLLRDHQDQP